MDEGRIGELALKAPVPKQELETKGNKDDPEDGQQNLPYSFNIAPTSPQAEVSWRIEYFQLKESVRKALDKKRQSHF